MIPGSIYEIPADAKFETFEPNSKLIALVQEVQRQNSVVLQQNALILRWVCYPLGIISRDVVAGEWEFTPSPDHPVTS